MARQATSSWRMQCLYVCVERCNSADQPCPSRIPATHPLAHTQKEQLFLEALSSYYYDGQALISDEEFANLKDDLVWNGSKVGRGMAAAGGGAAVVRACRPHPCMCCSALLPFCPAAQPVTKLALATSVPPPGRWRC